MKRPSRIPMRKGNGLRDCVAVGECRPRHHPKAKNTRDWCKGRVGIPHIWEWLPWMRKYRPNQRARVRNRVTEEPVCFGCGRQDYRRRSYCRLCGEPWPKTNYLLGAWRSYPYRGKVRYYRESVVAPCVHCGAPYDVPREEAQSA